MAFGENGVRERTTNGLKNLRWAMKHSKIRKTIHHDLIMIMIKANLSLSCQKLLRKLNESADKIRLHLHNNEKLWKLSE